MQSAGKAEARDVAGRGVSLSDRPGGIRDWVEKGGIKALDKSGAVNESQGENVAQKCLGIKNTRKEDTKKGAQKAPFNECEKGDLNPHPGNVGTSTSS